MVIYSVILNQISQLKNDAANYFVFPRCLKVAVYKILVCEIDSILDAVMKS